jgi:hypothetical protein
VKAAFRVDNDVALRLLAEGEVAAFLDHETVVNDATGVDSRARLRVADQPEGSSAVTDEEAATSDPASRQSRSK